jgi:hypothetical protein
MAEPTATLDELRTDLAAHMRIQREKSVETLAAGVANGGFARVSPAR